MSTSASAAWVQNLAINNIDVSRDRVLSSTRPRFNQHQTPKDQRLPVSQSRIAGLSDSDSAMTTSGQEAAAKRLDRTQNA